ncbi:MAG TPA: ROK family protein [Candidatus Eisenbacteria bacterium]|nr:ROK family protein [Candidatus Eisenbacteria bacterium]
MKARGTRSPRTLSIDIGATGLKAAVLDPRGRLLTDRMRIKTPHPARPAPVLEALGTLVTAMPRFDRVAAGFPGVVEDNVVRTAANLHPDWIGVNLARRLERLTGRPARVANDADVQGMAVIAGKGVEMVITLGTGVGSAMFLDGRLVPNLELGHHPFRHGRTYEELLGDHERKRIGKRKWHKRLGAAIETLLKAFNPRRLYLGGGNARLIEGRLPPRVQVVSNVAGVLGGIHLWGAAAAPRARKGAGSRP